MDAERRARHREQPPAAEERVRLQRTPRPARPARLRGPATLADRQRPGFSLVPDSHPRGGATE